MASVAPHGRLVMWSCFPRQLCMEHAHGSQLRRQTTIVFMAAPSLSAFGRYSTPAHLASLPAQLLTPKNTHLLRIFTNPESLLALLSN